MASGDSSELTYSECCYVETAFGGIQNRNTIRKIGEIMLPNKPVDCFCSIFRFDRELREHVEQTGSVKGFKSRLCYADYLWLDIDDNNLDRAKETTAQLIFHLESQYNLVSQMIRLYFSGKKDFHIGIPAESFGWKPSPYLPRIVRRIANELAGGRPIDQRIYDTTRLLRMPGSIHSGSGLYKTRLNPVRFQNGLPIEEIVEFARSNQSFVPQEAIAFKLNINLNEVYSATMQNLAKGRHKQLASAKNQPNLRKPCINALLQGVSKGMRNDAANRLAIQFKKAGKSHRQTLSRLMNWNASNDPPLAQHEVERIVESAYSGDANYDYSCNDPILASVCDYKCEVKANKRASNDNTMRTSFLALPDGSIIEMLYRPDRKPSTFFVKYGGGQLEYVDRVIHPTTSQRTLPFKASDIIEKGTVRFPSEVMEYESERTLLAEVNSHINRYLRLSPFYLKLASYYVLFSWVHDNYNTLPYLRALGGWGSGKSRFLQTIGLICYKPIVASGASTVSPIFRLIDRYGGTLVIDEADFPRSDDSADIIKILNTGNQKGCPVLRSGSKQRNFEPESYDVFGPKLIASRHEFKDRALESRCLTETMDGRFERGSVPISLPDAFYDEALLLRNKLLMFRLRHYGKTKIDEAISELNIEPRLVQVLEPIAGIIEDKDEKAALIRFAEERNQRIIEEKLESTEGKVACAICELWRDKSTDEMTMKRIADKVNEKHPTIERYQTKPRKVGSIVRDKFRLSTTKRRAGVCLNLDRSNEEHLEVVARSYGFEFNPD